MAGDTLSSIHAAVVIAAAGSSSRMGTSVRKQYLPLGAGTVLSEAVKPFLQILQCTVLVVTIPADEDETGAAAALFSDKDIQPLLARTKLIFVHGGADRRESVRLALEAVSSSGIDCDIVLIHDAARPFVTGRIIKDTAEAAVRYGAAVPAVPPVDTQKEINGQGIITRHLQRSALVCVQTPQAFLFSKLLEAHRKAALDGHTYTDDTEIWNNYAGRVVTVPGDICNKKITFSSDMDNIMNNRHITMHTGLGYDIHPLVPGRRLLLGGIEIPFDKGEAGHSDGDVLFHAITDALLGASALGDIGSFFPPEDSKWKDADSAFLLETVWQKVTEAGWSLINMDCIVKLEQPKFLPYRSAVRNSIAEVLRTGSENIFVKAKTGEKMGETGQGNAVEAWCSCLLQKL